MKDTKNFQERYNRWKNGERYWDIRGVELPKYNTGKYITVEKDDGSVYNVNPNVANSSEITVTTPEVEVVGKNPNFYGGSAFRPNEAIHLFDKLMGNTVGRVMQPITKIPGVMPVLRTLTPSNWVGTIRTGVAPWSENNPGFGTSENDQALNSLFNWGVSPAMSKVSFNKIPHTGKQFFNSLPYKTIYNTQDAIHKVGNFMRSNPFNMRSYFFNNMLKEARRNPQFMLKNIKPLHQYKTYIKGATDLTKQRYQYAYKNNRELFGQYDKQYGGFVIGSTPVEMNLNNITTMDYIPYRQIKKLTDSKNPFVNIPAYFKANMEPAFSMDNLIKINKKALRDLGFDKDVTYSHELNHSLTPTYITTYAPNGMSFSHLKKGTRNYLTHDNFTELKARGTQLKNYFGITDGQPITGDMLKYAAKNYVKDLGFDNNMTQMFSSIKDWDAAAKWFTDYGL